MLQAVLILLYPFISVISGAPAEERIRLPGKPGGDVDHPPTLHILDHYRHFTVEEKHRLWKLVLKKVTVYRSQDGKLPIRLYPNLP